MGKKDKNKKKGKGAEKTAVKTEKKLSNKIRKELQALGEDDIESIIHEIEKEDQKRVQVKETTVEPPSRRLNFTFVAHPDKEQLILYGGEFFNGQQTLVYNDLFFYNIPTNTWTVLKAPGGPPPRCGHQMVTTSSNKGLLWVFGGEFVSPTQSQFHHYRDLWAYHISKKEWEKICAPNGPSARSGHRMVYVKKQLLVFGGFHDNLRDYKYFNDVYSFNIETYKWIRLVTSGTAPSARSGCCMAALNDGRVLIYGGYSKERIKKDVDKGHVYSDSFLLTQDKNDTTGVKWKWTSVKLGGKHFSPRCSMPITTNANCSSAYCYGGVFDVEDDDENISGNFYNDFLQLDLEKLAWKKLFIEKKETKQQNTNKKSDGVEEMEVQDTEDTIKTTTISDDGIFKVTLGASSSNATIKPTVSRDAPEEFKPSPRINSGLTIKHGILYLYGGMCEDGDKQITYNDFHCVDLKKLDEWKTIIADDTAKSEWLGSESESEDSTGGEDDDEEESEESNKSEMETD